MLPVSAGAFMQTPFTAVAAFGRRIKRIAPFTTARSGKPNVINPPAQFLTDVGERRTLGRNLDHPDLATPPIIPAGAKDGPAWIASVVNAIGESKFWNSTAIFIMWDDWGGWFDPVQPVYKDYDGLGFRVPLLIDLALRQAWAGSRTCSTRLRACCASWKITSRSGAARKERRSRERSGERSRGLRLHAKAPQVHKDLRQQARIILDAARAASVATPGKIPASETRS